MLEGSVRRMGTCGHHRLIRAQDQTYLWAVNYDRQLPGMLDTTVKSLSIADQVKLELMSEERRQPVRMLSEPRSARSLSAWALSLYEIPTADAFRARLPCAGNEHDLVCLAHSGLLMPSWYSCSGDVEPKECPQGQRVQQAPA
jgi:hypothetical protein